MTFHQLIRLAGALALAGLLVSAAPLLAQANVTTAQIEGVVRDESGGALPGVTVDGVNVDTGFRRSQTTDAGGRYLLTLLPPGRYTVTANLKGFATSRREGLILALGSSNRVDVTMKLARVSETVTVSGEAPLVEGSKTELSATVNATSIQNLPLQTRNFTDLVLLTPGAVDSGSGRVTIGGQRGIQNSFNVDGADSNSSFFGEQRGGTRPPFTFSQGAIQEFQVVSSSYSAQYGNAAGGLINAITKSGTNAFHGEAFWFYRSKNLTETDANGFKADGYLQHQFGGFVGGPIVKDKLFFFVGYDAQRLKDPYEAKYDNEGTALDPLTNPVNLAALTRWGIDPATEWGTITQTNDVDSPFFKLSWNASDAVSLTIRNNYNSQAGDNLTNGRTFANSGISNNGLEKNSFDSLAGSANWVASPSLFNETILQWANEKRPRLANDTTLPETVISQFGRFGQNNFLPNNLEETRYQVINNLTWFSGQNTVKLGVEYSHVKYLDDFYRYQNGVFSYSNYTNWVAGRPQSYRQDFSDYDGLVDYTSDFIYGYFQDEWRPSNRFTLNFGVRFEYQRQPDSTDVNPLYPAVESIPSDRNNWAPRLGFSWDPEGNAKGFLRGGVGVFYVSTPSLLTANALLNNGVRVLDFIINCPSNVCPSAVPAYPNRLTSPPTTGGVKPNIFVFQPEFQNTETTRVSLGYEREIVSDLAAGVDLVYAKMRHLERVADLNLRIVGVLPDGRTRYSTSPRPNTNFGAIQQFTSDGDGDYRAAIVNVRKRYSNGYQLNVAYTYAIQHDTQSNERSVSLSSNTPEDSFNLNADYSYGDFDTRHNVVVSGVFDLPLGFRLSPLFRWRSGFPYSAGNSIDANGDNIFNDRANDLVNCAQGATSLQCDLGPNHAIRNGQRQGSFNSIDLTLSKEFRDLIGPVSVTLYAQGFNLGGSSNRTVTGGNLNQIISAGTVSGVQKYQYNANFGVPNSVGLPRRFQVGARIAF